MNIIKVKCIEKVTYKHKGYVMKYGNAQFCAKYKTFPNFIKICPLKKRKFEKNTFHIFYFLKT